MVGNCFLAQVFDYAVWATQLTRAAINTEKTNVQFRHTDYTVSGKKGHVHSDYNSRLSLWNFIILLPLVTGMNTAQLHVIYLLNGLMTS